MVAAGVKSQDKKAMLRFLCLFRGSEKCASSQFLVTIKISACLPRVQKIRCC
jgi:hypothetical protein